MALKRSVVAGATGVSRASTAGGAGAGAGTGVGEGVGMVPAAVKAAVAGASSSDGAATVAAAAAAGAAAAANKVAFPAPRPPAYAAAQAKAQAFAPATPATPATPAAPAAPATTSPPRAAPGGSFDEQMLEADTFDLHCLLAPTGTKFFVTCEPRAPNMEALLHTCAGGSGSLLLLRGPPMLG